ncbi:unnamed protein product [Heterosigma akashiwo]
MLFWTKWSQVATQMCWPERRPPGQSWTSTGRSGRPTRGRTTAGWTSGASSSTTGTSARWLRQMMIFLPCCARPGRNLVAGGHGREQQKESCRVQGWQNSRLFLLWGSLMGGKSEERSRRVTVGDSVVSGGKCGGSGSIKLHLHCLI